MSSINVLSKEVAELISAGEVIERPASVIKELVENSIDSGAKHITVEIKNGGISYMRVTDDGCGIAFDDVPTAFLRHATSKVVTKSDLDNIYTLGFRGEALASVCAVAKVEIMTKQKDDDMGTIYKIAGSNEISHEKSGCPNGTTIIVRDLFYNVPARAKFMKKDVTEANTVSNIVQKIALSHPNIAVKMIRDNRLEFNSAGDGDLYSAIYAVYGKDFAHDLIPVDYSDNGIKISGYVIKPLYAKYNRAFQNFFVNGRYIKSKLMSSGLESAYENLIMTGRFPACVLMAELPPSMIDVNIHPTKAEVRFTDERAVTGAMYFAVKNAFENNGLLYEFEKEEPRDWFKHDEPEPPVQQELIFTPVSQIAEKEAELVQAEKISEPPVNTANTEDYKIPQTDNTENKTAVEHSPQPEKEYAPVSENSSEENGYDKGEYYFDGTPELIGESPDGYKKPLFIRPEMIDQDALQKELEKNEESNEPKHVNLMEFLKPEVTSTPKIKVIGEAFGLYIIVECEGQLIIIDKHASHERIIFERLKSRNGRQYSQKLLVGVKLLLTSEEFDAIENNTELLEDLGFAFDLSEKPYITATALPTFMTDSEAEQIITEVAENLIMNKVKPQSAYLDDLLHEMACKMAVKANDKSSPEEMKALVEQVISDERIRHCPHGRPVMFRMSRASLDHKFKRS